MKTFKLLKTASGTAGAGRGMWGGELATFQAGFADGSSALVDADGAGATLVYASGAATVPGAAGATWKKFGIPSTPGSAGGIAFLATLDVGPGGVLSTNAKRLFFQGGSSASVATGDAAPGLAAGNLFSAFKDPVVSPGASAFAFAGTAKLGATATTGVWWQADGGTLQDAVATVGATYAKFASLAATDLGPVFTAKLTGAASTADVGLWALDSLGALRQLLREGDPLDGKTIKSFTVLTAPSGSKGVRRSYTGDGRIIVRVAFTDGSSELVKITLP